MLLSPFEAHLEEIVMILFLWLKLAVEVTGGIMIGLGSSLAIARFLRGSFPPRVADFDGVRLTLARFLALALEFQLGADILSTAVTPSWNAIGKLGAIVVIRTTLNYFLSREVHDEAAAPTPEASLRPRQRGGTA
jgi:uncharacterized membrane protein